MSKLTIMAQPNQARSRRPWVNVYVPDFRYTAGEELNFFFLKIVSQVSKFTNSTEDSKQTQWGWRWLD
jgi:hypothetical protein